MSSDNEEYSSPKRSKKQTSIRSFFGTTNDVKEEEQLESRSESDGYLDEYVQLPPKPKRKKRIRIRKEAECVQCKKFKPIYGKQMCHTCCKRARKQLPDFNRPNIVCVKCHKTSKHLAKNMCANCYNAKLSKKRRANTTKHRECAGCKETKHIHAHDLCHKCYLRSKPKTKKGCEECGKVKILNGKLCHGCCKKKRAKTQQRMCHKCGIIRPHFGNNMCKECYDQERKTNIDKHKECTSCKQVKLIEGHGMCSACYSNVRKQQKEKDPTKHKECVECEQLKPIEARGMCKSCYVKIFVTPKRSAKRKQAKRSKRNKKHMAMLTPKIEQEEIKMEQIN